MEREAMNTKSENMTVNRFSDDETRSIKHRLRGDGAVFDGGDPDERLAVANHYIEDPVIVVDCREINSLNDFFQAIVAESAASDSIAQKRNNVRQYEVQIVLTHTDESLLIAEFDSLEQSMQRIVAHSAKGFCEHSDLSERQEFAYTCEDGDSVILANGDLAGRVKVWTLPE